MKSWTLLLILFAHNLAFSQNMQWAKSIGGTGFEQPTSIVLDAQENQYITGGFDGTVDFDPGSGVANLTAGVMSTDAFILKLNKNGGFVWVKQIGGLSYQQGDCIRLDQQGNIYTAGMYQGTVDFDPGPNTFTMTNPVPSTSNMFIQKLDSSGNFIWAKQFAGAVSIYGDDDLAIDGSGNLYISGIFANTMDFDLGPVSNILSAAGGTDAFITKWDASGNFVWVKQVGNDAFSGENITAVKVDLNDNPYLIGDFMDTLDLDPGAGVFLATTPTTNIVYTYLSKFLPNGSFVYAKVLEHNIWNSPITAGIVDLDFDNTGAMYISGTYKGNPDFNMGSAVDTLLAITASGFILKLDPSGNFNWVKKIVGCDSYPFTRLNIDSNNNLYFNGNFYSTVFPDPNNSNYSLMSKGNRDVFCTKLNSSGNFIWASQIGGPQNEFYYSSAISSSNNIYTAGEFYSTCDFDPSPATYSLTSQGETDIFIQKMNTSIYVGLRELQNDKLVLNVWPNPASEEVFIKSEQDLQISIFSSTGALVLYYDSILKENSIQVKTLPQGVYFIIGSSESSLVRQKLVVLKN